MRKIYYLRGAKKNKVYNIICCKSGHCMSTFLVIECAPNYGTLNNVAEIKRTMKPIQHMAKNTFVLGLQPASPRPIFPFPFSFSRFSITFNTTIIASKVTKERFDAAHNTEIIKPVAKSISYGF